MEAEFGKNIMALIDGVTKLGRIEYMSKEDVQLENYRKMFLAMAKDIRVIMIKLADRLHNMRTLKYMREDKRHRIAKETLEVYAPLANRLGISNIKVELEDLCLRYLEPEAYYALVEEVKHKRKERQSSSPPSRTATACSASSTRCGSPSPGGSRTTSQCRSRTATSPSIRPS